MAMLLWRKPTSLTLLSSHFLLKVCTFRSKATAVVDNTDSSATKASVDKRQSASTNNSSKIHVPPLFSEERPHLDGYDIELVDNDTWQVSSGLAHVWRGLDKEMGLESYTEAFDEQVDDVASLQDDSDFDEIDNMRIRGNLFYKLDRDSKEFEEYRFDFHRKNSSKRKDNTKGKEKEESAKNNNCKENKRNRNPSHSSAFEVEKCSQIVKIGRVYDLLLDNMVGSSGIEKKKVRTPTFNQLTAPYHEPFCLDIYISKASVRACIIHRVTSKVVAVAHSISKDIKFDLRSTRNAAACTTVGAILAQRALADDIHDVIYTPRKGERLEGKLQIVLQSIIDNGINVKVKLKQRKPHEVSLSPSA
ncbi:hypothetical protein JCGZ_02175 [Jatropha curcas]|uniref:Uncharacterized protein n=1 Tax=Jatropha curcas TaxID=180498 RepID=A0A067KVL4_JATCU|nr:uncharacterized protein LOC105631991 [Jatropha curcas]XP_012069634.1 uncharacterized protein LOC105631991 [Jatropha curcas]KDP40177.1 hypothetical protein JCGZ_02175 [Jatropha curcas]